MKKLVILIVFIFIQQISFGQFTAITPKVGLTMSKLRDFPDTHYKPGYEYSVSAEYKLVKQFSILSALGLEQKGYLEKGTFQEVSGTFSEYQKYTSLNYINLPLLVKYIPFQNKGIYLIAGGYAGYLIAVSERLQTSIEGSDKNEKTKKDVDDYYRWNAGLSAGAGYDIPTKGKGRINVETKYEFDVHLEKDIFPTTHTFSLSVGYSIGIFK
jgi:hypothetical protein